MRRWQTRSVSGSRIPLRSLRFSLRPLRLEAFYRKGRKENRKGRKEGASAIRGRRYFADAGSSLEAFANSIAWAEWLTANYRWRCGSQLQSSSLNSSTAFRSRKSGLCWANRHRNHRPFPPGTCNRSSNSRKTSGPKIQSTGARADARAHILAPFASCRGF